MMWYDNNMRHEKMMMMFVGHFLHPPPPPHHQPFIVYVHVRVCISTCIQKMQYDDTTNYESAIII